MSPKPTTETERYSLGVFLLFLCGIFYLLMKPFLMQIAVSMTIVVLSYPVFRQLTNIKFFDRHRRLSSFFMTLSVFFIIILPITLVVTIVGDQIYSIVQHLDLRATFQSFLSSDFYISHIEPLLHRVEAHMNTKINVLDYVSQFARQRVVSLYKFSPKVVLGTANYVIDFLIMIVTIYFLYLEGPKLFRFLIELSPMRDSHELELVDQFKTTIRATIFGTIVTSVVQAVLATIGFFICQLPIAIVLGVVTFFMSLIPFVGTAGVWIPVSIWLFFQGHEGLAIFQFLYGLIVIGGIDNILKPMLIGGKNKIHPLMIFFSLIGGISLMGPFGIFFGPVILASLLATITIYRKEVLKKNTDFTALDGRAG